MKILFADKAWEDYLHWQSNDPQILKRVNELIKDIQRSPYKGIGKPEPLRHALSGYWSRRITDEHRLVYRVESSTLLIAQMRFHY